MLLQLADAKPYVRTVSRTVKKPYMAFGNRYRRNRTEGVIAVISAVDRLHGRCCARYESEFHLQNPTQSTFIGLLDLNLVGHDFLDKQ